MRKVLLAVRLRHTKRRHKNDSLLRQRLVIQREWTGLEWYVCLQTWGVWVCSKVWFRLKWVSSHPFQRFPPASDRYLRCSVTHSQKRFITARTALYTTTLTKLTVGVRMSALSASERSNKKPRISCYFQQVIHYLKLLTLDRLQPTVGMRFVYHDHDHDHSHFIHEFLKRSIPE